MTVVEQLIEKVENGVHFHIDFKKKSMKVNGKYLVKDGEYSGEYGFLPCKALEKIEELYKNYKYSYPSERGEHYISYFMALPMEDMTDAEMVFGEEREIARAKLESYILGLMLSGFQWNSQEELKGKWFWQGNDKDLIIFKSWFE